MPVPDDRQAGLAERTRRHWREHARARRASIAAFIKMGALLAEADGEVERGGWLAYLERAGIPRRTAQRAIRLFRSGLSADEVAARGGIGAVPGRPRRGRAGSSAARHLDPIADAGTDAQRTLRRLTEKRRAAPCPAAPRPSSARAIHRSGGSPGRSGHRPGFTPCAPGARLAQGVAEGIRADIHNR